MFVGGMAEIRWVRSWMTRPRSVADQRLQPDLHIRENRINDAVKRSKLCVHCRLEKNEVSFTTEKGAPSLLLPATSARVVTFS